MKSISKTLLFILVLLMLVSTTTHTGYANSSDYIKITKNDSFTKNGQYNLSFTFKNVSKESTIKVTAQLLNPSGGVVWNYNGFEFKSGQTQPWKFGYNYSTLPSGTYTLKVHASDWNYAYGEVQGWTWSYGINHKAPDPSFAYKSYEIYYDKAGKLMHKINIQCKNMKGKRLYCKVYDAEGYLVADWGTDTPVRKTNNETGFFAWNGYTNGQKNPSGEYTFIITSSANKKVLEKTLNLKILEVPKG